MQGGAIFIYLSFLIIVKITPHPTIQQNIVLFQGTADFTGAEFYQCYSNYGNGQITVSNHKGSHFIIECQVVSDDSSVIVSQNNVTLIPDAYYVASSANGHNNLSGNTQRCRLYSGEILTNSDVFYKSNSDSQNIAIRIWVY